MYRMLVLDLDGTLLNKEKEIDSLTKNVLMKAAETMKIVLASARGYYRIERYVKELELEKKNQYTIAYNGSIIVDNKNGLYFEQSISIENMMELALFMKRKSFLRWILYTSNFSIELADVSNLSLFIKLHKIYKIVFLGEAEEVRREKELLPQNFYEMFEITRSESTRVEFVPKGMTKVCAIEKIANLLNISQQDIIAIGDGENDIEMLRYAGLGIAMGNASDAVKEAADSITDNNDNNGVGKALLRLKNSNQISIG